jgi:lysophospholipase L1-like esterase
MKNIIKYVIVVLCILTFSVFAKEKSVKMFKNGDVVAFIGDSITHNGFYQTIIYEYYVTRFPDRKIRFYNRGISGDTGYGVNKRLDRDVLIKKNNRATIMLGMNDVSRNLYGKKKPNKKTLKNRQYLLSKYKSNMDKIIRRLSEAGIQVTIITPSIYDQTVKAKAKNLFGVNDALIKCAQSNKELAVKYNCSVIELNAPMLKVNAEMQKKNPAESLIGHDRVHPTVLGHYIMSYVILRTQNVPKLVAKVVVDAKRAKVLKAIKCKIGKISSTPTRVEFIYSPESLPLSAGKNYQKAMKIIPSAWNLNQEIIAITGLRNTTKYSMRIGAKKLGVFTGKKLAKGIDVAMLNSPQQKQAKCLFRLLMKVQRLESKLRYLVKVDEMLRTKKVDVNNAVAVDKYIANYLSELKKKKSRYVNYFERLFKIYKTDKIRKIKIEKEIEAKLHQAGTLAKPESYKIMLEKI